MSKLLRTGIVSLLCVLTSSLSIGQSAAAASAETPSTPAAKLDLLNARITAKIEAGQREPADFAAESADFDALITHFEGDVSDDVARIAMMRVVFTAQILRDQDRAFDLLADLATTYEGTQTALYASQVQPQMATERAARARADELIGQAAPNIDFTWSTLPDLTNRTSLRGKVVVLDFWATWCGPCVATFPQLRQLTAHYADSPVAIIGVTSLQGRVNGLSPQPILTRDDPDREYELTQEFIKAKEMTWPVAFSAQPVFNPDYGIKGIPHLAIIAPDGTLRHNNLHPAMPHQEKLDLINAILTEFNLPVPTTSSE